MRKYIPATEHQDKIKHCSWWSNDVKYEISVPTFWTYVTLNWIWRHIWENTKDLKYIRSSISLFYPCLSCHISHAGAGHPQSLTGIAKGGHHSAVLAKALVRAALRPGTPGPNWPSHVPHKGVFAKGTLWTKAVLFQSKLSNFGSKESNAFTFPYQQQIQKFQPFEVISTNHISALN